MKNTDTTHETIHASWFQPLISPRAFPPDFSGLLTWDGEVPTVAPPYEIESTLRADGYHSESLVEVLGHAAQKQIHDFFIHYQANPKEYIETKISLATAGHQSPLIKAQKTNAAAIKIKN